MDLMLINPGGQKTIYQELSNNLTAIEPPIWCRLLAGYIRDLGYSVSIVDADAEDLNPYQISVRVSHEKPKLVAIVVHGHQPSASAQQMYSAVEISKRIPSNVPLILTGGLVSVLPERVLKETNADYAAVGEGFLTIEGLLKGSPLEEIPGLVWKNGKNETGSLVDIHKLHGNVWDLLPMEKYRAHNWQGTRQPYASIYTSLQCPYKCSFCCINAPFGGSGYRTRKPEDVINEVKHLHDEYGVKTFKIVDEMFVLKPTHYIPICEGLRDLNLDLNIWAYARVDTIKPETLALLRSAGIQWLALGIESGSAKVRDVSLKSLQNNDIFSIVKAIQEHDIKVIGNFIYGLTNDTLETMQETLDLAIELQCDYVNFYACQAYPGSYLYKVTPEEDLPETWSGYSQHSYDCKPLPTETLTAAQVLRFRDYAHCEYFKNDPEVSKPLKRKLY